MTTLRDLQRLFSGDVDANTRVLLHDQLADDTSDLRVLIDGIGASPLSVAIATAKPVSSLVDLCRLKGDSLTGDPRAKYEPRMRQLLKVELDEFQESKMTQFPEANRRLADDVFARCVADHLATPQQSSEFFLAFAVELAQLFAERATHVVRQGGQMAALSHPDERVAQHALSTNLGDTVTHPERVIKNYEGLRRLIQAAPELAKPFLLAVYAGRSYDEIAGLLGITLHAAKDAVEVAAVEVSVH